MKTTVFVTDNFQFRTIAEALLTIAVTSMKGQTDKKNFSNRVIQLKLFSVAFAKTYNTCRQRQSTNCQLFKISFLPRHQPCLYIRKKVIESFR
jgi:hypothetical protein